MFIVHVHCSLFMFIVHCSHGATLIFDDLFKPKTNKTKVICANSKFELRNVTVGEVA